jgi:hydroxypyruvate isomerase
MKRRSFLGSATCAGLGLIAGAAAAQTTATSKRINRLKQSVYIGVFGKQMSFEDTCRVASQLGFKGYDFVAPKDWPMLKNYGLIPSL